MCRIYQNGNDSLWVSIFTPFFVAALTYFVFGKLDELKKRKAQSRLGVAVISTLEEEVANGLKTMENIFTGSNSTQNLLPYKSWQGINTINDDILIRILEVTKDCPDVGFPASEIRIHTKNYFDHMVANWNDYCVKYRSNALDFSNAVRHDLQTYPGAARGVLSMLKNIKKLLNQNATKWWPV